MSISDLRHGRRALMRRLNELAEKPRLSDVEQLEFERHTNSIQSQDARIERAVDARDLEIDAALDALQSGHIIHPAARDDPYRDDAAAARRGMGAAKGMILGGLAKAMANAARHAHTSRANRGSQSAFGVDPCCRRCGNWRRAE